MYLDANCGPRSDIRTRGMPCFPIIVFRIMVATPSAVMLVEQGTVCIVFVYLSTNTIIASKPLDSGRGPIMSMVTTSHAQVGMWCGLNFVAFGCL